MAKRTDVAVVRILPFILYIYSLVVTIFELCGCELEIHKLHGNSVVYAFSLFIISLCNKEYHCIWNRAMYVFLMVVPMFNYISVKTDILDDSTYIYCIVSILSSTAIATAYLAIKHFIKVNKKK